MFFNKDKLEQLVTGYSLDPYERAMITKLENDIEDLIEEKECKKKILQTLCEQEEVHQVEYEAQVGANIANMASRQDDLEAIRAKQKIIITYIQHFQSEEFPIVKFSDEIGKYQKDYYFLKLKPFIDRARSFECDLIKLKELNAKCLELQRKASCSMATAS